MIALNISTAQISVLALFSSPSLLIPLDTSFSVKIVNTIKTLVTPTLAYPARPLFLSYLIQALTTHCMSYVHHNSWFSSYGWSFSVFPTAINGFNIHSVSAIKNVLYPWVLSFFHIPHIFYEQDLFAVPPHSTPNLTIWHIVNIQSMPLSTLIWATEIISQLFSLLPLLSPTILSQSSQGIF